MSVTEAMPRQFSGARVAEYRRKKGWNETKLAAEAGCSPQAIRDTESGKHFPGSELLGRIADALGLERIDDLFDRTP